MVLASTSVHMVEELSEMAATSVCVPRVRYSCFLRSQEIL